MKKLAALSLSLCLSGCMMGPDYHEPAVDLPDTWENAARNNEVKPRYLQDEVTWWENYNDPLLTQLVRDTIKFNYDLKVAFATICHARATLLGAEASLAPEIDGIGAFSHNENSLNTSQFSNQQSVLPVTPSVGGASFPGINRYFNLFRTGLTTTWEIDLFGRIRRNIESAEASLEAQVNDMHDVLVSLIADVVTTYINLRTFQKQLEINQNALKEWDLIYKLNTSLLKAGLATEIEVAQAETARDQTAARIPPLKGDIKTAMHHLALLVGKPPTTLYNLLSGVKPIPQAPARIFAGLPSDLLKRRPDIQAAERNLAAANAQIGVAEASLFATFTFTGTIGYQSNHSQNFISPGSGFYSLSPGFLWPLVDFGRVRAKINAAMAIRDQNYFQYMSILLNALKDVEDSLVNYTQEAKRYSDLMSAYKASKIAAEVSLLRYESGLITFMTVLQAEIAFQNVSLEKVQSQALLSLYSVGLYKALGGGWQVDRTDWTRGESLVLWPWTED